MKKETCTWNDYEREKSKLNEMEWDPKKYEAEIRKITEKLKL